MGRTNPKQIPVPDFTWKIATVLEPGQSLSDIDANTQVIALITPNRRPPAGKTGPVQLPGGETRQVANWEHWPNWRVNVNYLEEITGYDFFSDLPQEIQQVIQADDSSELTLPLQSKP
ncbi:DNA/RNA non-specific endonuclease [Okeania sp.]|uniref:DNA/RNA non-specific endonuclease n=1 Tax=Okeania sp. TaxID=3100323 RepID=UPI002B4B62CC|nr:DNA/RNA non-specific endonuclease [Okeania sp.]MEB3340030.1 DNA/RNA non-specific endonuclease [Okeania sp.]